MIYLIDPTTADAASLGTVIRGFQDRKGAEKVQVRLSRKGLETIIIGLGRRWSPGKPAPRASYEAWLAEIAGAEVL